MPIDLHISGGQSGWFKKLVKKAARLAIIFVFFWVTIPHRHYPVTFEQRTQHMIVFMDEDTHEAEGTCTGTAVGPHAILTADHCEEIAGETTTIDIDLSMQDYHLLSDGDDGRDHIIDPLDGPPFTNYLSESSLLSSSSARLGERVVMYGCGGGIYPPVRKEGRLDTSNDDPSDVDRHVKLAWYTIDAIPGDSGSAIFGEDGRVLGLMTYEGGGGFALNFTPKAIHLAHTFDIDVLDAKLAAEAAGAKLPKNTQPKK